MAEKEWLEDIERYRLKLEEEKMMEERRVGMVMLLHFSYSKNDEDYFEYLLTHIFSPKSDRKEETPRNGRTEKEKSCRGKTEERRRRKKAKN